MTGGGHSLICGLLAAVTHMAMNDVVGVATCKSTRLEALVEGRPQLLIHHGKVFEDVMASAQLTYHERQAAPRQVGCVCAEDVPSAILENQGGISVIPCTRTTGDPQRPTGGEA
jgi:uncharacterized membrane protein YcaP (DUF421 family)